MVGQNGRVFSLLRFRTMSTRMTDPRNAQRLTRVGALIRNTSLDHLPLLINLLKGDLTLVGPRPMEIQVVELTDPMWQQYFQVKPGVFNYAVLKLGKSWTPSRLSGPNLNQALEIDYQQKHSSMRDVQLFVQWLVTYITSRGNVKARGIPDPEAEHKSQD
jgi:lipopolysaccharide/colanic/teichoic acid biosynthesis glycosyltransferase